MGTFQTIGGTVQFSVNPAKELYDLIGLDTAFFAALSAPLSSLTADAEFLRLLDHDGNLFIRVDDLRVALSFLKKHLPDCSVFDESGPQIALASLADESIKSFILTHDELVVDGIVTLAAARDFRTGIATAKLKGDGILLPTALDQAEDADFLNKILSLGGGATNASGESGVTTGGLKRFIACATGYLAWRENMLPKLPESVDVMALYQAFGAVCSKVDEYFSCCELVKLDPANGIRFQLNPEKGLPDINLKDQSALDSAIRDAVLALPDGNVTLRLGDPRLNPAYAGALKMLLGSFSLERLTFEKWREIKGLLSSGADYYLSTDGGAVGKLDEKFLREAIQEERLKVFYTLWTEDEGVGTVVADVENLIKLLVFKNYIVDFVDDFVNFKVFFDSRKHSMVQAGTLFFDGMRFDLTTWIDSVADHKKMACQANLCLVYVELLTASAVTGKKLVSVVITSGALTHIYVGKPIVFQDHVGSYYNGKIVDVLDGPISFKQSLLLPFRKLGALIGNNFQKYADLSSLEKRLNSATAPAPAAPAANNVKNFLTGGSMMLLAGGVGVAAVGSSAAYIVKSLGQLTWTRLLGGLLGLLFLILLPTALIALYRLRRRELGAFLEASGWAINLPMRLSMVTARIFTYRPTHPAGCTFDRLEFFRRQQKNAAMSAKGYFSLVNVCLASGVIFAFLCIIVVIKG